MVDMYSKVESENCLYMKHSEMRDTTANGNVIRDLCHKLILPASFIEGPQYMHETTQDAMS